MEVETDRDFVVTRRKQQKRNALRDHNATTDYSDASFDCQNGTFLSERSLFVWLLLFRILNAVLIKTFFVPDEFWQGPEIAHRIVFGYGYLTWEWKEGLRGWTSPLIFAAGYKMLAVLGIDTAKALVVVPRLIQSFFAAFGDLFLYKLAAKRFDLQTGRWTLICYLMSWFTFYSVTRTLTNSLETVLTTIALFYWPYNVKKENNGKDVFKALNFAAFSCIIRPTAAIVWIPLCTWYLINSPNKQEYIFRCIVPVGIMAMFWSLMVNSWFYGKGTFVELNFIKFNVINDMGTFYGSHPWHWYLTQGFPVVMFTHMIPFLGGIYKAASRQQTLAWLFLWTIFVYSFLGHKEFRFIFPVVPIAMCYCGLFLNTLCEPGVTKQKQTTDQGVLAWLLQSGWKAKLLMVFLAVTNIPLMLYTSIVHQKGTIDVMEYIQVESAKTRKDNEMSVLFLMPCHSTPFYSFVHRNISMRILECPPSDKQGYIDEADQFFMNPSLWLTEQFGNSLYDKEQDHLPTHIVMYNVLLPDVSVFLEKFYYKKQAAFFHTHFPEGRIGSEVLFYSRKKNVSTNT